MTDERRKYVRVGTNVAAAITDAKGESGKAAITNVSERGVFVRADIRPDLHRPVHVQFILKPDHTLCEASGTVAWHAPHGVGVFFDSINDAFRDYIGVLVKASASVNPAPKNQALERILGEIDVELS